MRTGVRLAAASFLWSHIITVIVIVVIIIALNLAWCILIKATATPCTPLSTDSAQ